jgi:SAM-dependent methyltransferase
MNCRHCSKEIKLSLIDLGTSPPSNAYLKRDDLNKPEKWFPLRVLVCESCWLVQTEDFASAEELFDEDYAYFSSFSSSWLKHAEDYVEKMTGRFSLNSQSHVVEVASNDGYLLQYVKERGIPCTGIEPTKSTAQACLQKGIAVVQEFFGVNLAQQMVKEGKSADLTVANNVLAHVPDINDFVKGFSILLKQGGVATFEFPHLVNLIREKQFDTIYHEHFSYLSLRAVKNIFNANGLEIFDVEELTTHGGSLRVYAQKVGDKYQPSEKVIKLLNMEEALGILRPEYYSNFQREAEHIKFELLDFLLQAKAKNKIVMAYGAAAKGNTLLNFAGIRSDLISCVVDANPAKQNKSLPGSRIKIFDPGLILENKPDYVVIFPWNLKWEIVSQLECIRDWNGKFVIAIPSLEIL